MFSVENSLCRSGVESYGIQDSVLGLKIYSKSGAAVSMATIESQQPEKFQNVQLRVLRCPKQVVIVKLAEARVFERFSVHLENITDVAILNESEIQMISNDNLNDLISINLNTRNVSHIDISKLKLNNRRFIYVRDWLVGMFNFDDLMIFVKSDSTIVVTNSVFDLISITTIDKTNVKFSTTLGPFLFLVSDSVIKVVSLISYDVVESINLDFKVSSVINVDEVTFQLECNKGQLYQLTINNDGLVDSLSTKQLYDEIIRTILIRSSKSFHETPEYTQNEIKFKQLRHYQLLKAQRLINTDFDAAMDIFINYLAPYDVVLNHLPSDIQTVLKDCDLGEEQENSQTLHQLYQLISYLNDTKRKMVKLSKADASYKCGNDLSIPSSIYQPMDIPKSLIEIDNNLLICYFLTNFKVINSFLRNCHCSIEFVEKLCLKFGFIDSLLEFLLNRQKFNGILDKIDQVSDDHKKVYYLSQMVKFHQLNLVLDYIEKHQDLLSSVENFQKLFLSSSYSQRESLQLLKFIQSSLNHNDSYLIQFLEFMLDDPQVSIILVDQLLSLYLLESYNSNYDKILNIFKNYQYDPKKFLDRLPPPYDNEPKAKLIIYPLDKLSQYDKIEKLIPILNNDDSIDYLKKLYTRSPEIGSNLSMNVLKDFILGGSFDNVMIMINELEFLDFESILNLLPDDFIINITTKQEGFCHLMSNKLLSSNVTIDNIQVTNVNLKLRLINLNFEKSHLERECFRIDSKSKCNVCGKGFTKSEIMAISDQMVVHYSCDKLVNKS